MEEKKNIQKEIEELSPFLARLKEEKAFESNNDVPPQYFKELSDELWDRIQAEEAQKPATQIKRWWGHLQNQLDFLLKPQLAIGLVTLVLLLIAIQWFRPSANTGMTASANSLEKLDNLPDEALYNYVMDNIGEYQTSDFAEFGTTISFDNFLPVDQEDDALDAIINEYLEEMDNIDIQDLL